MTLWIRSQDKSNLIKIDRIFVDNKELYNETTAGRLTCLGRYKTETRALQVIDEIQKKITEASFLWIESNGIEIKHERQIKYLQDAVKEGLPILDSKLQLKSTNVDTIVYDMPQE